MPSYLQLAPEQGGNQFGPFTGAFQIGSDAKRCQITIGLPNIAPVHATVRDHGNGTFTIAPTQRGLGVLLVRGGQFRTIDGPVDAQAGDQIVVGGQQGARFTLVFNPGGKPGKPRPIAGVGMVGGPTGYQGPGPAQAGSSGPVAGGMFAGSAAARRYDRQGGFGNAMANEVKRQAGARLLARLGLGQYWSMIYRFQSGGMMQPRFLIGAFGGIAVLVGGAIVSCAGVVTTWWAAHH